MFDRGYVSIKLRCDLAAQDCTAHIPPKRGMVDPPAWDARLALRRDKTRRSFLAFTCLTATIANLRLANSGHRP